MCCGPRPLAKAHAEWLLALPVTGRWSPGLWQALPFSLGVGSLMGRTRTHHAGHTGHTGHAAGTQVLLLLTLSYCKLTHSLSSPHNSSAHSRPSSVLTKSYLLPLHLDPPPTPDVTRSTTHTARAPSPSHTRLAPASTPSFDHSTNSLSTRTLHSPHRPVFLVYPRAHTSHPHTLFFLQTTS